MVAGCGPSCVKYLFFTFNFLIFLCGGAILGVALWARFDNNFQSAINVAVKDGANYPTDIQNVHIVLYVIAAVGGFLVLCGFLGCCGACCESTALLGLFFSIILILFLAEIAGAIYIFVKKDTIKEDIGQWYKSALVDKYYQEQEGGQIRKLLDETQRSLECCGAFGCKDYGNRDAPPSCGCQTDPKRPGCYDKVFEQLKKHITIVAIVAACVVIVELMAMIFACVLCSAVRRSAYY